MPISITALEKIIYEVFPNAKVKIIDTAGDQDHYSLEIEDKSFMGVKLIDQHKMVKKALSQALGSNLHSITIKTISPAKEEYNI